MYWPTSAWDPIPSLPGGPGGPGGPVLNEPPGKPWTNLIYI